VKPVAGIDVGFVIEIGAYIRVPACPHSALDCSINNSPPRHQRETDPKLCRLTRTWALGRARRLKRGRERHIIKSAVFACQRRSRGPGCLRPPTKRARAPQKVSPGWNFREGAKFPAPGFEFPARDQIRLQNSLQDCLGDFCKKTTQYQRGIFPADQFAADWLVSQAFLQFETGCPCKTQQIPCSA
jgi:hypothetical protein